MAVKMSKAELSRAADRLQSIKNRLANVRKQAERTTEKAVRTAEISGTAFAMGVVQGKTGDVEVMGVPLELGAGLGLLALGYFNAAGKMSDHLINVGDGMMACYMATLGRGVGQAWEEKSEKEGTKQVEGGQKTLSKGVSLTAEEIAHAAAMAQAAQ